jgi:hypothetical protein
MPTIIFSIHLLARFMTNATKSHLAYAKTVLRYVFSNRHRSFTYCDSRSTTLAPGQLGAYADSSWADVIPARKSTYSYVLMLNNAAVSWRSALSTTLATSTAAAELIALCSCAQEVAWARKFLSELGFPQLAPTTIFEDNAAAKAIAEQSNFKGKNKHLTFAGPSYVTSSSEASFVLKRYLVACSWLILVRELVLIQISFGYPAPSLVKSPFKTCNLRRGSRLMDSRRGSSSCQEPFYLLSFDSIVFLDSMSFCQVCATFEVRRGVWQR